MKKINENIAYAKAILNKSGINTESEEYKDYLRIRELCDKNHGYVGILTKIRFVDGVTDMDEIESIFNVIKNSKIDINKLNKMSYDQILDIFYDNFSDKGDNKDLELIYKDSQYSYYRVYTHKGILKIGSPSWCLKTKSNWDSYTSRYTHQWVVVDNDYLKGIITPENMYLQNYQSNKGFIRYGVSLNPDDFSYVAFTDNNHRINHKPSNYTFYGVLYTILNLERGNMYSYWYKLPGCVHVPDTKVWQRVVDKSTFLHNLSIPKEYKNSAPIKSLDSSNEVYVVCSETYSNIIGTIMLHENSPKCFYPTQQRKNITFANLYSSISKNIIENYALNSNSTIYYGIKLLKKQITMSDVESHEKFISKVGKWLIFDYNSTFYQVVNTEMNGYEIPNYTLDGSAFDMTNPMYYYVSKKDFAVFKTESKYYSKYATEVIEFLRNLDKPDIEKEPDITDTPPSDTPPSDQKKVRGFWDFLRGRK